MEKIIIAYSRHDNLGDEYSDKYKFEAHKLIDSVYDEIRVAKDTCITSLFVEIKKVEWEKSESIEPVYSLNINEKFLLQFRIEELIKIGDIKKIATKLNEIVLEKTRKGDL